MPKSYIFLLFFFCYSIALLYFGKSGYSDNENVEDFFLDGKKMGLFACVSTFVGTWFSAASMQGLPGSIYTYGLTFVFYAVVPWFIGAGLLVVLTPKLRASGALTLPAYFNVRYKSNMLQVTTGILIMITFILYIVIQIRGFGIVISEFLEIPYTLGIFIVYIFILYTTFGGLSSIAKSDGFNFIIICTGVFMTAVLVFSKLGEVSHFFEQASNIEGYAIKGFQYFTPKGSLLHPLAGGNMPVISLVSAFFGWGLGLATNPQYTARIIAAKDDATAIKMIKRSVLLLSVVYAGVIFIGLGSRIIIPSIVGVDSVDAIMPFIVNSLFDTPVSGFVMLAIIAAAISTANSQLLVVSSSFILDVYKILSPNQYTDDKQLLMSRLVVFVAGSVSLVLAISPPESLLIYGGYIWGIFSVTFLVPLYGGLFLSYATRRSVMYSMGSGLLMMLFLIIRSYGTNTIFAIHPAMPGVLISVFVFWITAKLERNGVL